MLKNLYILSFVFFLGIAQSVAQVYWADSTLLLEGKIVGSDTLPNYDVKEIPVFAPKKFKNRRHKRRYTRLMKNVKKAYPFALIAREELRKMNDSLANIEGEKARKKYIKEYERQMFFEYENDLRKLTFSQGKIMLKLVYREMGNTSYVLIQEYRGNFSAAFWQGIARIFGSNLKSEYDPEGEDADIEEIIMLIEAGLI